MALDIPNPFAQYTLKFSGPTRSGRAAVVYGLQTQIGTDLSTLGDTIADLWASTVMPGMHQAFTLNGWSIVNDLEGYDGTIIEDGNRTGDLAPPQVACLVKKATALRGRKFQGRSFLPGLLNDSDINDSGGLSTGRLDSIQGYLDAFWDGLNTIDVEQCLLHEAPTPPTLVTTYQVQALVATQRRRLR